MNHKIIQQFREQADTSEVNAFIQLSAKKEAEKNAGGYKADLGFENSRTIAKTKLQIKKERIDEENKQKEEFQERQEIILATPKRSTRAPITKGEEDEKLQELQQAANQHDNDEFKRKVNEDLEESFKMFDINGDGKISLHELFSVMSSVKDVTVEDAQEILEEVDLDGDGEINYEEFKAVMYDKLMQGTHVEDLQEAFDVFDADGDGFISPLEIQAVFEKLGQLISTEEALDLMYDCDTNSDGLIDFEEFKAFYKKIDRFAVLPSGPSVAPSAGGSISELSGVISRRASAYSNAQSFV